MKKGKVILLLSMQIIVGDGFNWRVDSTFFSIFNKPSARICACSNS